MITTASGPAAPAPPAPRGPLTAWLLDRLRRDPHDVGTPPAAWTADDVLDDDGQLALYCCYELHYRGFAGVDDGWEWEPSLLAARSVLERRFLDELAPPDRHRRATDAVAELRALIADAEGPSLSSHMVARGTMEQLREFQVHRSAYQLKEADPHTWALPRLGGRPKAAMVEIQSDEYGGGDLAAMHATLFADTMAALGLDTRYGAYLDLIPGLTLATCNVATLFGLHRRWRGALVGHLALFEMTSVVPMGRYAETCDRLGLPEAARRFYDVHVAADAHHEVVAVQDMVGGLLDDEQDLAADVVFGARSLMALERRLTGHLLESWAVGGTSLRRPLVHIDTAATAA
jgi:hypothetical protein